MSTPIRAGTTIGRYIVVERLGAGGLGVVFSADDPKLDRKVALKLLRAPMRGAAREIAQQRLLREAQAMAKVDHPNVVAVHDVGTHDGAVFVAMELVRGKTLRAWLDDLGPARRWQEVLPPLLDAARGLAAAHALGLVHRDFKPDNVMVGDDGRVRVMDFGLVRAIGAVQEGMPQLDPSRSLEPEAKSDAEIADDARARVRARLVGLGRLSEPLPSDDVTQAVAPTLDGDGEAASVDAAFDGALTQAGALLGTPAYMAPEQIEGATVDARCDQFALCVTMWEAIYGARPFDAPTWSELAVQILDARLAAPPHARAPGWLHAVLVRGLRPVPADRFADVPQLCAAIVAGRRRRRRLATGAMAAILLASGGAWWSVRADPCRAAKREIDTVWSEPQRALVRDGIAHEGSALARDTAPRAIAAIDAYATAWTAARVEACRATHVDRTQSDTLLDRSMRCLTARQLALLSLVDLLAEGEDGTAERAVSAVKRLPDIARCRDADALLAEVEAPDDPATAARVDRMRTVLAHAEALDGLGRYADGAAEVERLRVRAEEVGYAPAIARAALLHGRLLDGAGDPAAAADALREAAKVGRASRDDETAAAAEVRLVFVVGYRQGRADEGRGWAEHAEAAVQRLGEGTPLRARLAGFRGVLEFASGQIDEALPLLSQAVELSEARLGPDHPETLEAIYNLAIAHRRTGDLDTARDLHERVRSRREATLGPAHPAVGESLQALGVVAESRGDHVRAAELLEHARQILEGALGPAHPKVAGVWSDLGTVRTAEGRHDEAIACFERAETIWIDSLGPDHPNVQRARRNRDRALAARESAG